ncbi:MAG: phenylacetate--CoA ligase family protein [Planctomycetes bacterium]|nr:phenylacetate--CoA ligase family protein [Planctomycetota bacterium]
MTYASVVKHMVFPLAQALAGGGTLDYIRRWEKTQWLPPDRMRELQLEKLKKMLAHAACSVPYYRESFHKIGFEPGDLKSIGDLDGLPVLDKRDLREHRDEFLAEGLTEKVLTAKTGGSTGEPLAFPIGNSLRATAVANMVRCRRWWGIDIGDKSANFWGHSRYIKHRPLDGLRKALSLAKGRVLNRIVCSAYDMSDESMEGYRRRIEKFGPAFLIGYATSLYVFADFLVRSGLANPAPGLKAVISTAEVLYDWQAETIRNAFGCPVVSEYGMCEAGIIAYECPSHSMHTADETHIVEIVPVEGADSGDIVITELENYAAPLIRYNTKDMARRVEGPCACGRGLSRISKVEGRAYDIIYASNGSVVAGALLTHTMKSLPKVGKYQVVQRDLRAVDISYTAAEPLDEDARGFVVRTLQKYLGADVEVNIERVADIPKERSGKHRWLKSLVSREDARGARESRR